MQKGPNILEKEDNIVDFSTARKALITGGPTGEENWLKLLPKGTMFVCKRRNAPKDMLALELYFVLEHKETVSNILQKIPTGQQADLWVDSLEFSRFYVHKEDLAHVELEYGPDGLEEKEETEKTEDGNDKGTVQQE